MADIFSKEKRSAVMAAIRSRGNRATELKLMGLLRKHRITGWRRGFPLFGKPDFVFPALKLAVFVDGDFWHGHPTRSRVPATRKKFWAAKIHRNRTRDRLVTRTLRSKGWRVLRIWEHALSRKMQPGTIGRLMRAMMSPSESSTRVVDNESSGR